MQKSKDILIETQYLAPIAFYALQINKNNLVLEAAEHYQKGSYRNRCHIMGANGILRLSIPLKGGRNHGKSIKEVELSYDEKWNQVHLHSIRSAYGTSAYFDHYFDDLCTILNKRWQYLFELNKKLIEFTFEVLDLEVTIKENLKYSDDQSIFVDLRNKISPKNITPQICEINFKPYFQVFSDKYPFARNLSILDVLFNLGPESRLYLKEINQQIYF